METLFAVQRGYWSYINSLPGNGIGVSLVVSTSLEYHHLLFTFLDVVYFDLIRILFL